VDALGLAVEVVEQQVLAQVVGSGEVGFAAGNLANLWVPCKKCVYETFLNLASEPTVCRQYQAESEAQTSHKQGNETSAKETVARKNETQAIRPGETS
jgi:hypothetical protein